MGIFFSILLVLILLSVAFSSTIDDIYFGVKARKPLNNSYKQPIIKYNRFYTLLPKESQKRFERKMQYFLQSKDFIPRDLSEVTDEMKAMIASAAVQLTFGLPNITLRHFDKILVYPNDYYSTINRQYHKGEVNPRFKSIALSWHHFVEGFANPIDGINLGLHEMAHALKLENIIENGEHHFFDLVEYKKWLAIAALEIDKIRKGEESIFRHYASVNEDEFFAVCMEVYFEQPHQLFDYHPKLYKTLSNLLHQDTIQLYGKQSA